MLELKAVTIEAGSFILNNISLSVAKGRCHVIVGPTGGGKTLLLESIIGFRKPTQGIIRLAGKNLNSEKIEQRGISYVPQNLSVFPHLTVRENILYGLRYSPKENDKSLAMELAQTLKIEHLLERSTGNLSGGERQRVALVRALAIGNKYLQIGRAHV